MYILCRNFLIHSYISWVDDFSEVVIGPANIGLYEIFSSFSVVLYNKGIVKLYIHNVVYSLLHVEHDFCFIQYS